MWTESLLCSWELTVLKYHPCDEGELRVVLGFAGVQRTSLSQRGTVAERGKKIYMTS